MTGGNGMTEQECKNRQCPLWDDETGCPVLTEARVLLEDVESCSLAKVSVDYDDDEEEA